MARVADTQIVGNSTGGATVEQEVEVQERCPRWRFQGCCGVQIGMSCKLLHGEQTVILGDDV